MVMIDSLLLPPGIIIILLLLGIIFLPIARGLGIFLILVSTLSFYVMSTSVGASYLLHSLENYPSLKLDSLAQSEASAIVILSGSNKNYPVESSVTLSSASYERDTYAAKLYQKVKLPIYITGGNADNTGKAESKIMAQDLQKRFNIPVFLTEEKSRNTYENAINLKEKLDNAKIKSFYLVTNSWHMQRAMWVFQKLGFTPIPAPVNEAMVVRDAKQWQNWLPDNNNLNVSTKALHEYVGLLWYKMHYF